jgi:hypothetical protein
MKPNIPFVITGVQCFDTGAQIFFGGLDDRRNVPACDCADMQDWHATQPTMRIRV